MLSGSGVKRADKNFNIRHPLCDILREGYSSMTQKSYLAGLTISIPAIRCTQKEYYSPKREKGSV